MTWGAKEEIEQIQQRLGLAPEDLVVKTIGHAVDQAGLIASNTESIAESQAQENDHEVVRH